MGGAGQVGYGPLLAIDGPPPLPPEFGLLQAAEAPAAGVRIITDVGQGPTDARLGLREGTLLDHAGEERWLNGVEVFPYPPDLAAVFDPCAQGTWNIPEGFGTALKHPQFGAMTVHLDETCTSSRVWNQEEYKARAVASLLAVESAGVAAELMNGTKMPLNPHFSDGDGGFPNGNTPTSVANGIALLEDEIAKSGRLGLIHMSPAVATIARERLAVDVRNKVIRTISGNIVIPDAGYRGGSQPAGGAPAHPASSGTQEWMYATGPIDIRRSEIFVTPGTVAEALDRGMGATNGNTNAITYRAQRYYLAVWGKHVQSAVLIDRCFTTCTS